jgi:amidase
MAREHLWQLGAAELSAAIRAGAVSSREAVQSCLARLEQVNPRLNAVVLALADTALAEADRADAAVRRGEPLGVLHGVPVTTVAADQRAARPTTAWPRTGPVPEADSAVVANLRRAGAIIIGRTNTPCYSMRWFTDNELHGRTLSPDARITPGGSSGGAAAAVATGIGPIAQAGTASRARSVPGGCCASWAPALVRARAVLQPERHDAAGDRLPAHGRGRSPAPSRTCDSGSRRWLSRTGSARRAHRIGPPPARPSGSR